MQGDSKVCPVAPPSLNMHAIPLIQRVNQLLLNLLILPVIQVVDFFRLTEDFGKPASDFRHRISDNGEASLVSANIPVHDLPGLVLIADLKSLLFPAQAAAGFLCLRRKRQFSKCIHAGRPAVHSSLCLSALIGALKILQLSGDKTLVGINSRVISVVIFKLGIRERSQESDSQVRAFINGMKRGPVNHRFQTHVPETKHRRPDNSLKAEGIPDIYRFLFPYFFSLYFKPDAVSLCPGIRNRVYFLLGKSIQKRGELLFVFRDILSKPVQITDVREIGLHDQIPDKGLVRIQRFPVSLIHHFPAVIHHVPVQGVLYAALLRNSPVRRSRDKQTINLQKKLRHYQHIPLPVLVGAGNHTAQLRIKKRQKPPHPDACLPCRIIRISPAGTVMLRQKLPVQPLVPVLQNPEIRLAGFLFLQCLPDILRIK